MSTSIKIGKGKQAKEALFIELASDGNPKTYKIINHDKRVIFQDGLYYLSQARTLANELIEILKDDIFLEAHRLIIKILEIEALKDYLFFYRFSEVKKPLSFEEFKHGIDYERILTERHNRAILKDQIEKYKAQLSTSDKSLGWMDDPRGGITGVELEAIITGKPFRR